MAKEIWEPKTWDACLFSCRLLYSGRLPLLLQKGYIFLRTSTGCWNIFKIKIKWENFTPRLPRKTKFLYSRADWFVQVSGWVAISITLYN